MIEKNGRHMLQKVALAIVFVSCSGTASFAQRGTAQPAPAEEKYPDTLSREIHHQLNVLPYYSVFDNLIFRVQGGKVTLGGSVVRPTLKVHAEQAVKDLSGVISVVNQIEVLPVSTSDDELRRALYRAIYEDKALERYAISTQPSIHIVVKNGNVDLEGTVDSETDRSQAGARAQSAANVLQLKNNLTVREKQSANK